jgi:hypothetical protein
VKIGGLLMSKQAARPGEVVLWKANANSLQGRRALGGRLYLTNERLLFNPHFVDAMTGGRQWSVDCSEISAVGREERDPHRPVASVRAVLRIEMSDGKEERFVVNRLDEVVARLREAVAEPPDNPAGRGSYSGG